MHPTERAPAGPRGIIGAAAEAAAAAHLRRRGWVVLGRNLRVGRDEIDILAREPGDPPVLVVLEVRARSRPGFGSPLESVDDGKVARLYRATWALRRGSHPAVAGAELADNAVDFGCLEGFLQAQGWQDGAEAFGQHRFSCAGGADEKNVVAPGGGDLQGAFDGFLAFDVGEIELVFRGEIK